MTNVSRKHFVHATGAAAASMALVPGSRAFAQTAPALTTVTVGVFPSPDMATLLYAQSQHAFEKAGIDLQLQNMGNGGATLAAAAGGSLQFGYANTFSLIQAFQRGIPLKLVAPGAMYSSKAPTIKLLVAADSTIQSGKDLVGKTIGTTLVNDITGLSLVAWLAREGVDEANVHFFESPPNLLLSALQSHRVDAVLLFDPFLTAALAAGARSIANPFDAIGNDFMAACWFSVVPWVNEHRAVARNFASVLERTASYVNGHYLETVPLLADFSKIPAAVLEKMSPSVSAPSITPRELQPLIDAAVKFHRIPAAVKAQDMIFTG
ncbi:MAG TPA: ABC transporter substrate-binding protein [Candidatus Lustribacter sp.]|nr:ABC transporter substrate-binding protein [Candidatus Lustribacter sp.]